MRKKIRSERVNSNIRVMIFLFLGKAVKLRYETVVCSRGTIIKQHRRRVLYLPIGYSS